MACFTILMQDDKSLVITNKINLRQHEAMVDKIAFVVPYQWTDDLDLRDFTCVLYWKDPTNVVHVDTLTKESDVYKETYQRYFLPVDSPFNRYAGTLECYLVFTYVDTEASPQVSYKLTSGTVDIPILTIKDYYAVIPSESFSYIDTQVATLTSKVNELLAAADVYESTKADNIGINTDGSVQLKANDTWIGDAINVAVTEVEDDSDEDEDGVINLNVRYSS